jgi:transposase
MNGVAAASKYPAELKERAVAMVRELEKELGPGRGAIARVASQLGVNPESLRYWVRRTEEGRRGPGVPAVEPDNARIAELERENRELRRANEILKLASAFFAREMDPRPPS